MILKKRIQKPDITRLNKILKPDITRLNKIQKPDITRLKVIKRVSTDQTLMYFAQIRLSRTLHRSDSHVLFTDQTLTYFTRTLKY